MPTNLFSVDSEGVERVNSQKDVPNVCVDEGVVVTSFQMINDHPLQVNITVNYIIINKNK